MHQLYTIHENKHGFPKMIGSIDGMRCGLQMFPNTWRGQLMQGDMKHSKKNLKQWHHMFIGYGMHFWCTGCQQ